MLPIINFEIGDLTVTSEIYPIFIYISMLTGFVLSIFQLKKLDISIKKVVFIYIVICASFLVGARLLNFMLLYEDYNRLGISIFDPKLRYFSLYGGIILSFSMLLFVLYKLKINKWIFLDKLTIPFLICFFIMKIGCFLNGCCYGKITNHFFSIPLPIRQVEKLSAIKSVSFLVKDITLRVYPTQLMEAFMALVIVLLLVVFRRQLFEGASILISIILFSLARLTILNLRSVSYSDFIIHVGYPFLYLSIIMVGIVILINKRRKAHSQNYLSKDKLCSNHK